MFNIFEEATEVAALPNLRTQTAGRSRHAGYAKFTPSSPTSSTCCFRAAAKDVPSATTPATFDKVKSSASAVAYCAGGQRQAGHGEAVIEEIFDQDLMINVVKPNFAMNGWP